MARGRNAALVLVLAGVLLAPGCVRKAGRQNPPLPAPRGSEAAAQRGGEGLEGAPAASRAPALPGAVTVMIDNHPDAWPQAGIDQADVVYEAVAEGGITRLLAVFYSHAPEKIGPVRSARPYFVAIARGYDAPYAHAGGSEDAYASLRRLAVRDLDEIRNAGAYFWRARDRKAPHNLYTGASRLLEAAARRGWTLTPPPAFPVGRPEGGEAAGSVTITYSDNRWYRYVTSYRFSGDRYEKEVNGAPFLADGGKPVTAANVLILFVPTRPVGDGEGHMDIAVEGEGEALFLVGGMAYEGRWRKRSAAEPFTFTLGGEPMLFSPGPTWVNLVGDRSQVSLAPPPGAEAGGQGRPAAP